MIICIRLRSERPCVTALKFSVNGNRGCSDAQRHFEGAQKAVTRFTRSGATTTLPNGTKRITESSKLGIRLAYHPMAGELRVKSLDECLKVTGRPESNPRMLLTR